MCSYLVAVEGMMDDTSLLNCIFGNEEAEMVGGQADGNNVDGGKNVDDENNVDDKNNVVEEDEAMVLYDHSPYLIYTVQEEDEDVGHGVDARDDMYFLESNKLSLLENEYDGLSGIDSSCNESTSEDDEVDPSHDNELQRKISKSIDLKHYGKPLREHLMVP